MLRLTKGETNEIIITLAEKTRLTDPNYLFVFTSRQNDSQVKFVLLSSDDTSEYSYRYNKFSIVVDTYFTNKDTGHWSYKIYEQESSSNTDESGLNCLETGIMILSEAEEEGQTQYEADSPVYKVYNAEG